jgi:GPH family glycoside/pentoside/hexuronide:cation symporter
LPLTRERPNLVKTCAGEGLVSLQDGAPRALKPPVRVKFFYGLGQVVQSGGFDTALVFVFFYYTAVLGMPGLLAGAAVGISLCVDAVADPLVGSWSDNVRSRWGRRLPLMVLSIPLVGLGFGLLFSPPAGLAGAGLFIWLLVFSIAARCATSLFNVPYIALGAELADGYVERSRVVVWRTVLGLLATVFIVVLAYSVFFAGDDGLRRATAYPGFGWATAVVLAIGMGLCCLGVARYAAALPQATTDAAPMMRRLPSEVAEIFSNRSFRTLFFACLVVMVAIGVNATFNNHVNVYVWQITPAHIQTLTFGLLLGTLVGVSAAPLIQRRLEKRTLVMIGVTMLNLAWLVLPLIRAAGLYRPVGDDAVAPLMGMVAFAGVGIGLVLVAFPSMMADAADEHELLHDRRREGLYFAGLAFAGKAASGLGVLTAGVALDLVGMPREALLGALAAIPEDVRVRLVIAAGPVAAVISAVGVMFLWPYAISRTEHDRISEALRARRAPAQEPAQAS